MLPELPYPLRACYAGLPSAPHSAHECSLVLTLEDLSNKGKYVYMVQHVGPNIPTFYLHFNSYISLLDASLEHLENKKYYF